LRGGKTAESTIAIADKIAAARNETDPARLAACGC